MTKLTDNQYWERNYNPSEVGKVIFGPILKKYLRPVENKTCIEIGCVPGNYLVYIGKTFGYKPVGIDYLENTKQILEKNFEVNGIDDYSVIQEDFFKWKPAESYDLVYSIGFIEHFSEIELDKVIKKHVDLTKSGGTLIIEVPNFNYGQYLLHCIWDRKNLKSHNIKIMKRSFFSRKIVEKYGLKVRYLGYYGGLIRYWGLAPNSSYLKRLSYRIFRNIIINPIQKTAMKNWNNPIFSPYIFLIAQK